MVTGDLRTPRIYTWNHRTIYHWSSEFSINKPRSTASNSVNKIDRSNQFWFDRLVVSIPCRAWFKYSARNARNFSGTRFKIFPLPPPPTCFPNGWETNSRTDGPRIINLANSALFHLIQTSPRYIYIYIYIQVFLERGKSRSKLYTFNRPFYSNEEDERETRIDNDLSIEPRIQWIFFAKTCACSRRTRVSVLCCGDACEERGQEVGGAYRGRYHGTHAAGQRYLGETRGFLIIATANNVPATRCPCFSSLSILPRTQSSRRIGR